MNYTYYDGYKPKPDARNLLDTIITIVLDYQRQGFKLTLRQLYYQLVSKDLIANKKEEYDRIGNLVSRARLGGLMDWSSIEDRIRVPEKPPEFRSLDSLVNAAFSSFRLPRLMGQERYVELWVEKDALAGVLAPIADEYHVTLMVNRGYSSTSAMRESGLRVRSECDKIGATEAVILYLGDLDPSGEDMVRDIDDRLSQFMNHGLDITYSAGRPYRGGEVTVEEPVAQRERMPILGLEVKKVALTPEQVEEYDPPPNPAKITDSRAEKYIAMHGENSWEVDALPPRVLREIIETELREIIDPDLVEVIKEKEEADKQRLREALLSLERKSEPEKPKGKKKK